MSEHIETVERRQPIYSARVSAESSSPKNMANMSDPDAYGVIHGCCGDTMEFYLRLDGDRIVGATFATDGRESAIACGSMLTQMVRGMLLEEAGKVEPEDVIAALDGLPKGKLHCANLTVNTLREAIANWHVKEV